jgi:hypothetical protein
MLAFSESVRSLMVGQGEQPIADEQLQSGNIASTTQVITMPTVVIRLITIRIGQGIIRLQFPLSFAIALRHKLQYDRVHSIGRS